MLRLHEAVAMSFRVLFIRYVLALLALPGAVSYAQSSYRTDTSYVNELLKKGEKVEASKPTVALTYYSNAHKLAQKIDYKKGYFLSVRHLVYALNNMGRSKEARTIAEVSLQQAKRDTSKLDLAASYFSLAMTSYVQGDLKQAVHGYHQAAYYLRLLNDNSRLWSIYNNLGLVYKEQKLYDQAIDYFNKASTITLVSPPLKPYVGMVLSNIAITYSEQRNTKAARAYYQKARRWVDPADLDMLATLYNNIGEQFFQETQYDSSFQYHRQALLFSRKLNNPLLELHQLIRLASIHNALGQYEQAESLLKQAAGMVRKTDNDPTELRNMYEQYTVLSKAQRNYRAAFQWLTKYEALEDSLDNRETKTLLQEYEVKLKQAEAGQKLAEKQRRITQLEADRQRQNLWLLVAVLTAAVIGLALVFSYLYYRQRQRTAANALLAAEREHELAVVQSELRGQRKERLRISKEMHDDLGASLTAIGLLSEVMKTRMGTATTPEVEKISTISADMVTSMNEIIWSLNTQNDNLNGLIAYIRAYASEFLENASLTLRTQVQESPRDVSIRGTDRRNVFLTVKEALNNVVKHAQATQVTLVIQPEASQLQIDVCDNGRGFTANGQVNQRNGLVNMRNRMAESGGTCAILPSPTGTCVHITFPYLPVPTEEIRQT